MTLRHFMLSALIGAAAPLCAQLSGNYTVGGNAPAFPTLTAAVSALNAQGATGDVTFLLRPGTYTGQYALGAIGGTPGTIVFRSENGDPGSVVLEHDAASAAEDHIVRLDGTKHIQFVEMSFRPLDPAHGRAIHFLNDVYMLTVNGCIFHGQDGSGSTLLHGSPNTDPDVPPSLFVNVVANTFIGGQQALSFDFQGSASGWGQGIQVRNNIFRDQVRGAVEVMRARGEIAHNTITTSAGEWFTGIRTMHTGALVRIGGNTIDARCVEDCTGIEVSNTPQTAEPFGNMVDNNMVHVQGTGATVGIMAFNLWDASVVHNSVLVAGGDPAASHAFHHLGSFPDGQDLLLRNNILADRSGGTALRVEVAGNLGTADHNALFTTGAVLAHVGGADHADLAAYQGATGQGSGSVQLDPVFPLQPDLHLNSCVLEGLGQYILYAAEDIDYDPRTDPACDMGADEFTFTSGTIALPAITVPADELPYTLGFAAAFSGYQWSNGAQTPTISIATGGTYTCAVTDVHGCSYTLSIEVSVEGDPTGIAAHGPERVRLFPNPATDRITVEGAAPHAAYRVLTPTGQVVLAGNIAAGMLPVQGLPPGAYLLHIGLDDGPAYARFVKQ